MLVLAPEIGELVRRMAVSVLVSEVHKHLLSVLAFWLTIFILSIVYNTFIFKTKKINLCSWSIVLCHYVFCRNEGVQQIFNRF